MFSTRIRHLFLFACAKTVAGLVNISLLVTLTGWVFIKKNSKIIESSINEYKTQKRCSWYQKHGCTSSRKKRFTCQSITPLLASSIVLVARYSALESHTFFCLHTQSQTMFFVKIGLLVALTGWVFINKWNNYCVSNQWIKNKNKHVWVSKTQVILNRKKSLTR